MGRLILVHGGGEEAESLASEFFGSLLLGLLHSSHRTDPHAKSAEASRAGCLQLVTESGERFQIVRNDSGELISAGSPPPLPSPHVFRWIHAPREDRRQRWSLESWHEVQRLATGLTREERDAIESRTGTRLASLLDSTSPLDADPERSESSGVEDSTVVGSQPKLTSPEDQLRQLEARRNLVRSQRHAARDGLRRVGRLWPVHFQLRLVERWRREAGDPTELAALPERPRVALDDLDRRLSELEVEIQTARSAARESADAASSLRSRDRRLLDRAAEVDAVLRRHAVVPDLEREREELDQEQRAITQQLDDLSRHTFDETPDASRLLALDLESLARRLAELDRARSERTTAEEELARHRRLEPNEPPLFPLGVVVLLAIGVGTLAISFEAMNVVLSAVAYTVIWAAATWSGMWWVRSMRAEDDWAHHGERREQLESELHDRVDEFDRHHAEVGARLEGCPISQELRDADAPLLIGRLQEARSFLRQRRARETRSLVLERRIADARSAVARLIAELLPEATDRASNGTGGEDIAALLRNASLEAHRRRGVVERAQRELARWNATVERHEQRRQTAHQAREALQARLTQLGGGDLVHGCRTVENRMRAHHAAEWLEGRLFHEQTDLSAARTELDAARRVHESWVEDEGMVLGLTHLTEELDDELAALDAEVTHQRIRVEVEQLADPSRDAERRRLDELESYRDELTRVSKLVAEAETHFREHEQPALVERANTLIEKVAGRVDALRADDSGVRLPTAEGDPLEGVSLLALRLALSERFDPADDADTDDAEASSALERLPIFLQEDFGDWPEELRQSTWRLLRELSRDRQIFVFAPSPESFGLPASTARRDDRTVAVGKIPVPPSPLEKLSAVFRGRFGPFADRMRAFLGRNEPEPSPEANVDRTPTPELARAREILDHAIEGARPDPRRPRAETIDDNLMQPPTPKPSVEHSSADVSTPGG